MSIRKTIITTVVALTLVAMVAPGVAQGVTIDELLAQIALLNSQLLSLQGGTSGTANYAGIPAGFTFTRNLPVGIVHADVVKLKAVLIGEGCGNGITSTTYYGPKTQVNVQCFQNKYKVQISAFAGYTISSTGLVGTGTRAQLNALLSGIPGTPGQPPVVIPTGAGLTVALASTNPASGTIVDGQALYPLAKLTFTNGDNAEVKVTQLKLKRIGVSADASVANTYLFDGAVRLTDGAAVSSTIVNFNDSTGIFTIPSGGSKTISVLADINGSASETFGIQVVASTDVTTNASSVKGVFPITGNLHTLATGSLAGAEFNATTTPAAASIDPQNDYTMWQNSVIVTTRAIDMTRISLRKTGSVANTDLQNFRLYVDGVQVGSAVANLDANGYVTFDLSAAPKRMEAGTRVVKLMGDIIGGSSLAFTFNLWNSADVTLVDSQYNANVLPDLVADAAFSKRATGEQTVNSGVITFTKMTTSPSGNIVNAASNATLAKFEVKAAGERIKIETLKVSVVVNTAAVGYLRNGMLLANGVQIGSTSNLYDTTNTSPYYTTFNLGSSLIVEPGSPVTLEVRADIYDNDGVNDIIATSTIKVTIEGSSTENNATGMKSAATIDAPASDVSGNSLTVAAGSLSLSKNTSYTNHTVVAPLTAYKVASYNLAAATSEAVNITAINVTVDEVSGYASNLYVKYGTKTTSVKPTVAASNSWSINEVLAAGVTIPVEVYMDVSSGMTIGTGTVTLDIDGTTVSSAATSDSAVVDGQDLSYSSGNFTTAFAGTPASQVIAGGQQVEVARFKFTSSYQGYVISEIKIDPDTATSVSSNAEDVISYAVLKDGATVLGTESFNNIDTLGSTGGFYFTGLSIPVAASGTKTLTVDYVFATPSATNSTAGLRQIPALTYVLYSDPSGTLATITDAGTTYVGNSTWVYKAIPTLSSVDLSNTAVLSNNAVMDLYKFKVAAPSQGDISVKQFKLAIGWSDAVTADALELESLILLEDGVDITTSVSITDEDGDDVESTTGVTEMDSQIVITWLTTDESKVSSTTNKTYTLRGTPQGFVVAGGTDVTHDSVSLNLAMDTATSTAGYDYLTAYDSPTGILELASTAGGATNESAIFIWSDNSAVAHSASLTAGTSDWQNGYLLKDTLVTETWTK